MCGEWKKEKERGEWDEDRLVGEDKWGNDVVKYVICLRVCSVKLAVLVTVSCFTVSLTVTF